MSKLTISGAFCLFLYIHYNNAVCIRIHAAWGHFILYVFFSNRAALYAVRTGSVIYGFFLSARTLFAKFVSYESSQKIRPLIIDSARIPDPVQHKSRAARILFHALPCGYAAEYKDGIKSALNAGNVVDLNADFVKCIKQS